MEPKLLVAALAAIVALAVSAAAAPSTAQERAFRGPGRTPLAARARTRIEVVPAPLLYRRCASWYVLQQRPSGTVLFPEQHCWWARG